MRFATWRRFFKTLELGYDYLSGADHFLPFRRRNQQPISDLLRFPDGLFWVFEIKRSLSPKVERGFPSACHDLQPDRKILVYPGSEPYPLGGDIEVMPLSAAVQSIKP